MMLRRLALLALCTVPGMACLFQPAGTSQAGSGGTPCPGVSAQYILTCYPPEQAQQAGRLLGVPAFDPSSAVAHVTGLSLTQVIAGKRILPKPSRRVVTLWFDYGSVPLNVADPSPPTPKWVEVGEAVRHGKGVKGVVVTRGYSQMGNLITYDNWTLAENLPHHKLTVWVITNQDEATIRRIGRELLREPMPCTRATSTLIWWYLAPDQEQEVECIARSNRYVEKQLHTLPVYATFTLPWGGEDERVSGGVLAMTFDDVQHARGTFLFLDSTCGRGRGYRPVRYIATYTEVQKLYAYVNLRTHRLVGFTPDTDARLVGQARYPPRWRKRRPCSTLLKANGKPVGWP